MIFALALILLGAWLIWLNHRQENRDGGTLSNRPTVVVIPVEVVIPVQIVAPPPTAEERDFAQWSDQMEMDR